MWGLWKYIKFPLHNWGGEILCRFHSIFTACLLMSLIPKLLGNEANLHVVRYVHVRV